MDSIITHIHRLLGKDIGVLFMHQMLIRAFFVYILGVILVRINRRFMGVRTGYSFFLYILLGSILAGIIMGNIDFLHGLGTVTAIMLIDKSVALLAYIFPFIELLIKGRPSVLVQDGVIDWRMMRRHLITYNELKNALHHAWIDDMSKVKYAFFENSGTITIIKNDQNTK